MVTHHPNDSHPPFKIYQKEVYYRLKIWHLGLTHKIKIGWSADGQPHLKFIIYQAWLTSTLQSNCLGLVWAPPQPSLLSFQRPSRVLPCSFKGLSRHYLDNFYSHIPSRHFQYTFQICSRHILNNFQAVSRKFQDSFHAPSRLAQRPIRNHSNTSQTLSHDFPYSYPTLNTSWNTLKKLSKHVSNIFKAPFTSSPDAFQTTSRHPPDTI